MKKIWMGLLSVGAVLLVMTGCATAVDSSAIAGMTWNLEKESLRVQAGVTLPEHDVTLSIADGKVAGYAGVNRYFGPVELDPAARTIKFGHLGVTRMAGPHLAFESTYLQMLESVTAYSVNEDGRLLFYAADRVVAEFELD